MATHCYSRKLSILKKKWTSQPDQPCPTTSSERFSTLCSPHSSASIEAPCPKSTIPLRMIGSFFMRRSGARHVARTYLKCSSCWPSWAFPTTSQGSRRGHILSQQDPSQTFCRLFVFTLLTSIRPMARVKTAKTCGPNFKSPTIHLLQQVHPHSVPNIPAPSPERSLDFSSELPTSPGGFGFSLDYFFW